MAAQCGVALDTRVHRHACMQNVYASAATLPPKGHTYSNKVIPANSALLYSQAFKHESVGTISIQTTTVTDLRTSHLVAKRYQ